ncbi:MAG TPA: hypothetical protein VM573_00805 [Actinomycetota bacterium]|jgi:hypothetical protein|nr:hypothetical protein [Actinomycetota bacterium]
MSERPETRPIDRSDYARAHILVNVLRANFGEELHEIADSLRHAYEQDTHVLRRMPEIGLDDDEFLAREFGHTARLLEALFRGDHSMSTLESAGKTVCSEPGCPNLTYFGKCFECRLSDAGMIVEDDDSDDSDDSDDDDA